MRRIGPAAALVLCLAFASPSTAHAGGFETPDNGTEALGRGGAFTAKASDATALQYNVAGLAGQRGTRVLFDGKVSINNYSFTRDGTYPDAPTATTPWGRSFFPTVSNQGAPFFAPFLGVSSDFGYFNRLTFALGAYGPSGTGNPTYPLGVNGAPSPARYDVIQATSTIILPTVAAAYRLTDWLDVGLAFHYVIGNFDLINVSFADLSQPAPCANVEYQPCDTVNHLALTGSTFTASGGVMLHPASWLDVGLNVRGPINIAATGSVTSTPPEVAPAQGISTSPATFGTSLPAQIRLGGRVKVMDGLFESGDFEIDGVYEPWSATGLGPPVTIATTPFGPVDTTVVHKFQDVFSVRAGAAYNIQTSAASILTFRAGAYYESSATAPADTRIDFNTLEKLAGTVGAGFQIRGIGMNVAYAGITSPERVVTDGEIRPINPAQGGAPIGPNKDLFPAVNNGRYNGFIHMFSFGLRVELETLFGTKRSKRWTPQGTLPFEMLGVAPAPEPPKGEAKPGSTTEAAPAEATKPEPAAAPAPKAPEKIEKKKGTKPAAEPPPPPPPPDPKVKPKTLPNDDEKTRKLEDPFAN